MKTLSIKDPSNDATWEVVGHICEDNGGLCDGNLTLAHPWDDELTNKLMAKAVEQGVAEIVEVEEVEDDEMLKLLGLPTREDWDEDEIDTMKEAANTKFEWSHYGAYGAMDSRWFIVKK
jgi:hypothetical protein